MTDRHSPAQGPTQYWRNESWRSAAGDVTAMNGPANMGMTPQGSLHIEVNTVGND